MTAKTRKTAMFVGALAAFAVLAGYVLWRAIGTTGISVQTNAADNGLAAYTETLSDGQQAAAPDQTWMSYKEATTGISVGYQPYMAAWVARGEHYATRFAGDPYRSAFFVGYGAPLSAKAAEVQHEKYGPSASTVRDVVVRFYKGNLTPDELLLHYMDDVGISNQERSSHPIKVLSTRDLKVGGTTYKLVESVTGYDGANFVELVGQPLSNWTVYVQAHRNDALDAPLPENHELFSLIENVLAHIE